MLTITTELPWVWAGMAILAFSTIAAIMSMSPKYGVASEGVTRQPAGSPWEKTVLLSLLAGLVVLGIAIGIRWVRVGHAPYVDMFEILVSQTWSMALFYLFIYWRLPKLRGAAVIVFPAIWMMGSWALIVDPADSVVPATYYNNWKWAHIILGKIFLAASMVALGIAGVMLLRRIRRLAPAFSRMPSDDTLDRVAWRFVMLGLIFDSLMLIAGAVWAQDAWGRYWSWDDLETSSFLTWLAMAAGLHIRLTYRVPAWLSAWMIILIYVIAFGTYFGMPYGSQALHKGVV